MKRLFDPVADVIFRLIEGQIEQVKRAKEARVATTVLVGGFGSSPCIKERLLPWCAERNIHLNTPWTGAHELANLYDPSRHFNFDGNTRRLSKDHWSGETYLTGFMFWEIGKGEVLDEDTETNTTFACDFSEHFVGKHTHQLYACSLDDAPDTIENTRIENVGAVEYTLEGLDLSKVTSTVADGIKWYRLELTLNIRMSDEAGILMFRILYRGRAVGKAELGFSYT